MDSPQSEGSELSYYDEYSDSSEANSDGKDLNDGQLYPGQETQIKKHRRFYRHRKKHSQKVRR